MGENGRGVETNGDIAAGLVESTFGLIRSGLHLGLGLAAMALESARSVGEEAIKRGALVEQNGRESLASFEREKVAQMKSYLKRDQSKNGEGSIEAKVEQALATFDVPTRDDIRELHMHLAALGEKIKHVQSA